MVWQFIKGLHVVVAFLLVESRGTQNITWQETGIMHVCLFWSLSFLIKPPVFNLEGSNLMALSSPNYLPNALPPNKIVGLSFYFLKISQWGFSFNTWTFGGHNQTISKSSTSYSICTLLGAWRKDEWTFEGLMYLCTLRALCHYCTRWDRCIFIKQHIVIMYKNIQNEVIDLFVDII